MGSGVLVCVIALLLGNSSLVLEKSIVVFFYINNQEKHWVTRISFCVSSWFMNRLFLQALWA